MKKLKPLVTIGIPVYNGAKYLKDSLNSAINQTYKNIEIIISDDNSTDSSFEILKSFVKQSSHIKIYRQNINLGPIKNFNFVLNKASGQFFTWFAQDDIHDLNFVKKLIDCYENRNITSMMSDYRNFIGAKKYKIYEPPNFTIVNNFESVIYFLKSENLSLFYGLHETKFLKNIGGYHRDFRPYFKSSDFLTILKILLVGNFYFVNEVLFLKRDTGYFTNQFENLKKLPFIDLKKNIFRYLLFPIHFIFDLILGIKFIFTSKLIRKYKYILFYKIILLTNFRFITYYKVIFKV